MLAGLSGLEPETTESKSVVLPLHHRPTEINRIQFSIGLEPIALPLSDFSIRKKLESNQRVVRHCCMYPKLGAANRVRSGDLCLASTCVPDYAIAALIVLVKDSQSFGLSSTTRRPKFYRLTLFVSPNMEHFDPQQTHAVIAICTYMI
jgi:hypothetical protein